MVLTFAGNIVKHLGVQMYSGRPVPAIAELISNAWDADATKAEVELPLDTPWNPDDEDQTIVVRDDGHGMDWDMVRDAYLDVGRDRRKAEGTDRSPGGRILQGRKGIGKLAGFGIADVVEVETVHEEAVPDVDERTLIWLRLSLNELRNAGRDPAPADILYAGPISSAPEGRRTQPGTTVTLRRLHERRAYNKGQFFRYMTRRFLFIGPKFRVTINGEELRPEEYPVQWRWPEEGWKHDEVQGCGPVEYWIGFSEKPRKASEGDLAGVLVYTRKKVSQEATFFDISGGVTGQHGLRYLCGMVKAEWLDGGVEEPDLIATHRGSIAWDSPQGRAFEEWGQTLIKKKLKEWADLRSKEREKRTRQEVSPELAARFERLAPPYRSLANRFVDKFKSVEMEPEEFEEILSWFLDALENATLRRILEKLRDTDVSDLEQLDELFSKMEVRTAVTLLQIIESNLAAIETLEEMHLEDARERGVIAKHLKRNPWLIHPAWILHKAEGRVSTWIREEFGLGPTGEPEDRKRADYFCVGVAGTLHIVEIKRGGHAATKEDVMQADDYRQYVESRFDELTDPEAMSYGRVQSHLVASSLKPSARRAAEAYGDKGWVQFTNWSDLIERAKRTHHVFREALQESARGELDQNYGNAVGEEDRTSVQEQA